MPLKLIKNYKGQTVLTWSSETTEKEIFNLSKPIEDYTAYIKRKLEQGYKYENKLPQFLKWAPGVINIVDDAQDLLVTGLYLAKPLLRKLPSKLIPGVGWAMVANDLMNLITKILGTATTPGLAKHDLSKKIKRDTKKLANPTEAFKDFMAKGGWRDKLGMALQGLQATDTLFNKGLALGEIMAGLSDSSYSSLDFIWQNIRPDLLGNAEQRAINTSKAWAEMERSGQKVLDGIIKSGTKLWNDAKSLFGPKRSPLEDKASRFLIQIPQFSNIAPFLDDEDIIMLIAAQKMATGVLAEHPYPMLDYRADRITMLPFPMAQPINPVSVSVLKSFGADVNDFVPALDVSTHWPTIGHAIDQALNNEWDLELELRKRADKDIDLWSDVYDLYRESGEEVITKVTGVTPDKYTGTNKEMMRAASLFDYNLTLQKPFSDKDLWTWYLGALREAEVEGREIPTSGNFIESGKKNNLTVIPKQ